MTKKSGKEDEIAPSADVVVTTSKSSNTMIQQFLAARRAATSLLAINTPDNPATMTLIQQSLNGNSKDIPLIMWDAVNGWYGRNQAGKDEVISVLSEAKIMDDNDQPDLDYTLNFTEQAKLALRFQPKTILFLVNGQLQLTEPDRIQAIANLRDRFKRDGRMAVFLGPQHSFPPELASDITVIDEPLPDEDQLLDLVQRIGVKAKAVNLDNVAVQTVDRLRGLAAYPAEQAVSMSLVVDFSDKEKPVVSIDTSMLETRTNRMINDTVGLTVYTVKEQFTDLAGVNQAEDFHRGIITGIDPPRLICLIDEADKQLSGATADWVGDNGVNKDMLGVLCQRMEDWKSEGLVYYGPGGSGKTHFARAFAGSAGCRFVQMDLGALKGGHHGDSEKNVRAAFKTIEAIGGGQVLFIMTCNKMVSFPPEVKRRFFTNPAWFFDLLNEEGRRGAWIKHVNSYPELANRTEEEDLEELVKLEWTGAEIRNCCRLAYKQRRTVRDAARFIIPLSVADRDAIEQLRRGAAGKYLSAGEAGYYKYVPLQSNLPPEVEPALPGDRDFSFEN